MAYLRDITRRCGTCGKPATVELMSRRNEPMAPYCKGCGRKAEARLSQHEAAEPPKAYT